MTDTGNTRHEKMHFFAAVMAVLLGLACGGDPSITADYPAGMPLRSMLVDMTNQSPHLYLMVTNAGLMDAASARAVTGTFRTTRLLDIIDGAYDVDHRMRRFEPRSPRMTVHIFRGTETISGPYAVIHRGNVKIVQK